MKFKNNIVSGMPPNLYPKNRLKKKGEDNKIEDRYSYFIHIAAYLGGKAILPLRNHGGSFMIVKCTKAFRPQLRASGDDVRSLHIRCCGAGVIPRALPHFVYQSSAYQ